MAPRGNDSDLMLLTLMLRIYYNGNVDRVEDDILPSGRLACLTSPDASVMLAF
ncbi:5019_t:CDS:1, partial [Ambispora gerdemannii]